MSPTINENDYIIVIKYSKVNDIVGKFNPKRDTKVNRNQVVLFNLDNNYLSTTFHKDVTKKFFNSKFLKRTIGIAGDTVMISNGNVFVNGCLEKNNFYVNRRYIVQYKSFDSYKNILKNNTFKSNGLNVYDGLKSEVYLSKFILKSIPSSEIVGKPILKIDTVPSESIFPDFFDWSLDNWGPVIIPKAGDSANISINNISLYYNIIKSEGRSLEIDNNSVFIDGKKSSQYIFEKNYYFLMGDNRYKSTDSRHFGFIPYNNILGRVIFVSGKK